MPKSPAAQPTSLPGAKPHKRRQRYPGKYPKRFEEKYKEHDPGRFTETFQRVIDSGKTPAGTHRPILLDEVLAILAPQPGDLVVDCTLGYGGHARALLPRVLPGGRLVALDQDPVELPRTEARFRAAGFGPDVFTTCRGNFAGLSQVLAGLGLEGANLILADLGASSMQLDDPKRGFSFKHDGPLDMRMNPNRAQSASALIETITPGRLRELLATNSDEPFAERLGNALAGHSFPTTGSLAARVRTVLSGRNPEEVEHSVRRTFQALRISVNDEFSALDALLRQLPLCLRPGGRAAILTFHSGEDRRVKKAFAADHRAGRYSEIAGEVIRPTSAELRANPRSAPAKLRWARVGPAGLR